MSGYEVAQRIRANPQLAGVVLIALTGYGARDDLKAAQQAGFDDHLTKPATGDDLERILTSPCRRAPKR